jgi:hypothetical protein
MAMSERATDQQILDKLDATDNVAKRLLLIDLCVRRLRDAVSAIAEKDSEIKRLERSRDFYKARCESLQAVQSQMRDPERQAVCEILANGSTNAIAATATATQDGWRSMDSAPHRKKVVLKVRRESGKHFRVFASYCQPELHHEADPYPGCVEIDDGEFLCPADWYEETCGECPICREAWMVKVEGEPVGWYPIPPATATADKAGGE